MIQLNTGKGKNQKPVDIVVLQLLFNDIEITEKVNENGQEKQNKLGKLAVDGTNIKDLIVRIEAYQKFKSMKIIDGWVSPQGNTIKSLLKDAKLDPNTNRMDYIRSKLQPAHQVKSTDPSKTLNLYEKQYSTLSTANREGLKYILETGKKDDNLESIPELAYMLATTKHETAHSFRAISEWGKGAGRSYGNEITVVDPTTEKTYKNKYYGRGYVQLTWGYNYQRVDHKLGYGSFPNRNKTKPEDFNKGFTISNPSKSLYLNPDKALEKENAYYTMVWGMQKGVFTGKKVSNYISSGKIDYRNARRIINGLDKADDIAAYAEDLEILLLTSSA